MDADRINELKNRISELPKGNLTKKTINVKAYYYHRFTEDHKRYEKYIVFTCWSRNVWRR